MKKLGIVILLSFFLSFFMIGCSSPTIQQQRDILLKRAPNDYAEPGGKTPIKINDIRNQLVSSGWETDDFIKRLTDKCYSLSYYDSGVCALDFYYHELKEKEKEQRNTLCDKTPDCVKKRNIYQSAQNLNMVYNLVMARNTYSQSYFDGIIRRLCKSAGVGQRNGLSLRSMLNDVNQQEGLSPEIRHQFKQVVESCWVLSNNGVSDGTTMINTNY